MEASSRGGLQRGLAVGGSVDRERPPSVERRIGRADDEDGVTVDGS